MDRPRDSSDPVAAARQAADCDLGAVQLISDVATAHDYGTIGQGCDLVEVRAHDQDGQPVTALFPDLIVNLAPGAHVDADRRLGQNQQPQPLGQPSANENLLLIPPAQGGNLGFGICWFYAAGGQ